MIINYDTRGLTLEAKFEIIHLAKSICSGWWVDILDCRKSICRQQIDMSYGDILAKFNAQCHFSVIDRPKYLEVAFCTMCPNEDYFLWLHVLPDKAHLITQNLKIWK